MVRSSTLRLLLTALTIMLLLLPFVVLVTFAKGLSLSLGSEVLNALVYTVFQAAASACVALVFGVLGAFGLQGLARRFGSRIARWTEACILLPNAVPVLLVLLAVMKTLPFARGLTGVVLVHSILNAGLVAVSASRLFLSKVGGMAELAWIEGSSSRRFFFKGVMPALRDDLLLLFLFVFAVCFSSFAVPLVLAGSRATTLEVLIYQKIRVLSDWPGALGLSLVQVAAIFGLSWLLKREPSVPLAGRVSRTPLLTWLPGVIFVAAPSLLIAVGLCSGLSAGFAQISSMEVLQREFPKLLTGSLMVGLGAGLSCAAGLMALAFLAPTGALRKFLISYVAPSSVLTGFALLIVWRDPSPVAAILRIIAGVTLVSVPSFYRLQWDATLRALEGQRSVARTLGAGDGLVFTKVIYPQVVRHAFLLGGLASFWAWGDFALSSVVAGRTVTLAMLAHSLMESYRLDAATVLVWVLVMGGAVSFALFAGAGNVLGSKSQT